MGIVYTITNKNTGKVYVGISIQTLHRRKCEHLYRANRGVIGSKICSSIQKHGPLSFIFETIDTAHTIEELKRLEIHYVSLFDSFKNGYNMTLGGDYVPKETRLNVSGSGHFKAGKFIVTCPNGKDILVKGLRAFCRDVGIVYSNLYDTFRGKQRSHRGYSIKSKLNDYLETEYTQAGGSGAYPSSI
jgi:predicted GIY-YIG superfamily endonuclease